MGDGEAPVLWSEIKALRAEIQAVREGDMRALELQAKEYERRLDELNHHRAAIERRDGTFVSRDLHDREFQRVDKDIAGLSRIVWIGVGIALIGEGLLWLSVNHLLRAP